MTQVCPSTTTSRSLRAIANHLQAGQHPLVTGPIGDLFLLQDRALPLGDALECMGLTSFDVVVRVNAVDGITIVKGDQEYGRMCGATDGRVSGDAGDGEMPERERRLRELRRQAGPGEDDDVVVALRRCLVQEVASVLAIVEQADILLQDPAHHDQPDRVRIAGLQLALRQAARVGRYRNTCILIAGELQSIPSVLLSGCEDIRTIEVEAPARDERIAYLRTMIGSMHGAELLSNETAREAIAGELALLTDGDSLRTLDSLATFSSSGKRSILTPLSLVNMYRFGERPDYWGHLRPRLEQCRQVLTKRVFGQPRAVDAVMGVLAAGAMGLDLSANPLGAEGQPRGVLWFVGPTGVGKTELAKGVAEAVFGDQEAYTRLDMSTFAQEHAAERLMGAPPGYVGFERGGELTNAVRRRPNSVVLLDEIEKAHERVLDRFMSIFDDGRITDAQGRVTHFGETIVIATSNVGARELADAIERSAGDVSYEQIRTLSVDAVRRHFTAISRPEIFGRIEGGIVPFDILRAEVIDQIVMRIIASATFANGPRLEIDAPSACAMARAVLADPTQRVLGGRQVRNVFQRRLRELATWLARGHADATTVCIHFAAKSMFASVDGREAERVR